MERKYKKYRLITVTLIFLLYLFIAVPPVPLELRMTPQWFSSLENPASGEGLGSLLPFELAGRFGYLDPSGSFTINQVKGRNLSLSKERWSEYENQPQSLDIRDPQGRLLLTIPDGGGYPLFLDGQTYLISSSQTALSQVDGEGRIRWSHDFPAPLTAIDGAGGLILAGSLDGTVELLNGEGGQVAPPFEPGGSRYSVILACRISQDGSRIALVSGVDPQRFLLLERSGTSYSPRYHEALGEGFRREVHLAFIDQDRRVVFEREGGIGVYTIADRKSLFVPLEGEVYALDGSGEGGLLFLLTAEAGEQKPLAVIRLPDTRLLSAPFTSGTAFLGRQGTRVFIGGGKVLAAFDVGNR